jgi:hypothetical protein
MVWLYRSPLSVGRRRYFTKRQKTLSLRPEKSVAKLKFISKFVTIRLCCFQRNFYTLLSFTKALQILAKILFCMSQFTFSEYAAVTTWHRSTGRRHLLSSSFQGTDILNSYLPEIFVVWKILFQLRKISIFPFPKYYFHNSLTAV